MCKTSDFIKPHSIVVKITSLKVSLVRSGIGSLFCCYRDQGNFVKCCKNAIRARGGGKFLQLSLKYEVSSDCQGWGEIIHLMFSLSSSQSSEKSVIIIIDRETAVVSQIYFGSVFLNSQVEREGINHYNL